MDRTDRAGEDATHSLLTIDLSCSLCLNACVEALEGDCYVAAVRAHSADGCLEVAHTGGVDRILDIIRSIGHTIEVAPNGEAVMAAADVQVETCCARHSRPAVGRIIIGQPAARDVPSERDE